MKYNTGTVTLTNGSNVVTGDGTQKWAATGGIAAGQLFTKIGSGITYEVSHVTSNNQFELTAPYGGTTESGALYTVIQSFTPVHNIPYPEPGDVEIATIMKRAFIAIDGLL